MGCVTCEYYSKQHACEKIWWTWRNHVSRDDVPVSEFSLTSLFTSMPEYGAVDLRGLRRNTASKYCQRIFGSKIVGMYTFLTVIPALLV